MNAKMAELKRCFEAAGFLDVKTVISSGNVVFSTDLRAAREIERRAEGAMEQHLDRAFYTIVRSTDALKRLIQADPYAGFDVPVGAKRVVTFLRKSRPPGQPLPVELDGACIFAAIGTEVFSAYLPGPNGPAFMTLIEKTFGKDVTTRTWETVKKCANA